MREVVAASVEEQPFNVGASSRIRRQRKMKSGVDVSSRAGGRVIGYNKELVALVISNFDLNWLSAHHHI